MHWQMTPLLGAALLGLANARQPQITAAPITMAKRDSNIEIHQIYGAPIGVDTNYLTVEGSSTKWIGVNKDYLTESTKTTTINNVKTTTVVKPQLSVVTATAASDGVGVGDVTVLMADSIQEQVAAIIKEAVASCGAKKVKRAVGSCEINYLGTAAQNDVLHLLNPEELNILILKLADDAPQVLAAAFQVLKTQAQKNKFAILLAAFSVWALEKGGEVVHKYVFDGGQFGSSKEHPDGKGDHNQKTTAQKTTATSTATSCNPSATVNENSPACNDADCKGEDKVCKAEGKNKNCPCAMWTETLIEGHFDKGWSDQQQKILKGLKDNLPKVIPPQCFRNTHGNGFDGKPNAEPSAFCFCSSAKSDGGMTSGTYPTMSGDGDKACTYSTMPTKTISITIRTQQTGVSITSCRMESSYSLTPYCTCNDGKMHGQITTTYSGKAKTVCPDATATMTTSPGIPNGTPTAEPSCYPKHGDNAEKDEIIKLCAAEKSNFADVCRSSAKERISVWCPGRVKNFYQFPVPITENNYWAWFEKADNAPEDCKYTFKQGGSGNDNEVGARVDDLCVPAFQAIQKKCTWNGGEVKNVCGTFKYQSCLKGKDCKPGSPSG